MKLNLGSGAHPLEGFVNLDLPEWEWGKQLPFADNSVEAITVSHSLMYCPKQLWLAAFADMHRVLEPGGIVRITEDATDDPKSDRFGGYIDAVTLTSYERIRNNLALCGFNLLRLSSPWNTHFKDASLIQRWHGDTPKVFFVEGVKL